MYISMYVCMCVCMCVCVYVCIILTKFYSKIKCFFNYRINNFSFHFFLFRHKYRKERIKCFKYFINICMNKLTSFVLGLCEVETGQSNIILDIEESRGTRKFFFRLYLYYFVTKVLT